jgi:hypothetical protein
MLTENGYIDLDADLFACFSPARSIAATHEMRRAPTHYWTKAIAALHAYVNAFQIETGDSGEEYLLMVLSAAADGAATGWLAELRSNLEPSRLSTWLKELLVQLNEQHLNPTLTAMLDWADDYVINFTHFITLTQIHTNNNPLAHRDLVQAFLRHAAIWGARNQWGWDILIPIYLGDMDAPFDARKVSYIVIQVENSAERDKTTWKTDFGIGIAPFAGVNAVEHTRLCIWFDLQRAEGDLETYPEFQPSPARRQLRPRESGSPPRYHLRVSGHSQNIFEPLRHLDQKTVDRMAALIGSMRAYGTGPFDESGLDSSQLQRDRAFCQGLFLPETSIIKPADAKESDEPIDAKQPDEPK